MIHKSKCGYGDGGGNATASQDKTSHLRRSVSFLALIGLSTILTACSTSNANVKLARQTADTETAERDGRDSLLVLANEMAAEDRHAAAIPLYRQSLRRSLFGNSEASLGLGKSLMALGQYGEAIDVLERAFDGNEDNPETLRALGKAYLALGDTALAVVNYEEAVAIDSRNAAGYAGLGVAYDAAGRHSDAIGAFDRGLSTAGNHLDLLSNKGLSLIIAGDAGNAMPLLEEAVKNPASGAEHRQNLALAYALAGEHGKARRMASIDLDPESVEDTLAHFETLRGLTREDRVTYLLFGTVEEKKDIEHVANLTIKGDEGQKQRAVERVLTEPIPVEIAIPAAPEPAAPEPVKTAELDLPEMPPLMDSEGWAVQIAAYRNAADVMPGWYALKEKYAPIIGDLEPRRSEVDFGDRGEDPRGFFYRLNAGPLATREEAVVICEQLDRLGGACWVRPPEPREGRLPAVASAGETAESESGAAVRQSLAVQPQRDDWVVLSVTGETPEDDSPSEESEDAGEAEPDEDDPPEGEAPPRPE